MWKLTAERRAASTLTGYGNDVEFPTTTKALAIEAAGKTRYVDRGLTE
jgi:hypothetical protein